MNVGLGFNPMAFARVASATQNTQAQTQAVAHAGGNEFARDCVVRNSHRAKSMRLVGARVGQKKVLDKAGVTKPTAAKKA